MRGKHNLPRNSRHRELEISKRLNTYFNYRKDGWSISYSRGRARITDLIHKNLMNTNEWYLKDIKEKNRGMINGR